jgi:hypothetical protein
LSPRKPKSYKVERHEMRGMNNNHRRSNFTPSDDALLRQQPVTGISVKLLATMLRTNREALMHRADELGPSRYWFRWQSA